MPKWSSRGQKLSQLTSSTMRNAFTQSDPEAVSSASNPRWHERSRLHPKEARRRTKGTTPWSNEFPPASRQTIPGFYSSQQIERKKEKRPTSQDETDCVHERKGLPRRASKKAPESSFFPEREGQSRIDSLPGPFLFTRGSQRLTLRGTRWWWIRCFLLPLLLLLAPRMFLGCSLAFWASRLQERKKKIFCLSLVSKLVPFLLRQSDNTFPRTLERTENLLGSERERERRERIWGCWVRYIAEKRDALPTARSSAGEPTVGPVGPPRGAAAGCVEDWGGPPCRPWGASRPSSPPLVLALAMRRDSGDHACVVSGECRGFVGRGRKRVGDRRPLKCRGKSKLWIKSPNFTGSHSYHLPRSLFFGEFLLWAAANYESLCSCCL